MPRYYNGRRKAIGKVRPVRGDRRRTAAARLRSITRRQQRSLKSPTPRRGNAAQIGAQ